MIHHGYKCIFSHVPKTAGKSIRWMFGLPEFEYQYSIKNYQIENGFGHRRLAELASKDYFPLYYKFAFVRNPYDRLVSAFAYLNSGGCNDSDKLFRDQHLAVYNGCFPEFVEDLPRLLTAQHFRPQTAWVCSDDGALLCDFVGRYETLQQDLLAVGSRLGVSLGDIPILNASERGPFHSYYDAASRRRVAELYGDDLELFGYRWAD